MKTIDIIKKKPRRLNSKESLSSVETDLSKPPKNVLDLGKHLVRELGFEEGVDTLGRWMSHHVAELLFEADSGATTAIRNRASRKAVEAILKIWDYRASLPGDANPLAHYKDLLVVVSRLSPNDNAFHHYNGRPDARKEYLASVLFDNFTLLILALLLPKVPPGASLIDIASPAFDALTEDEQFILKTINDWAEALPPISKSDQRKAKNKNGDSDVETDYDEAALRFINNIEITLGELRKEIPVTAKSTDITVPF